VAVGEPSAPTDYFNAPVVTSMHKETRPKRAPLLRCVAYLQGSSSHRQEGGYLTLYRGVPSCGETDVETFPSSVDRVELLVLSVRAVNSGALQIQFG